MSLWTQPHRTGNRPGRRAGVAAIVLMVLVVLVLIGTIAVVVLRGDPGPSAQGREPDRAAEAAAGGGSPSVERTLPVVPPARGVVLPEGTATADGYPVGFPHTDAGAVAAAVEITRAQVGFDYDQAATVARTYAAPADVEVVTTRARAAVGYRRQRLGVPVIDIDIDTVTGTGTGTGGVAAPAAFVLTPFAFQVLEMDPGCYAVTVLSLASTTTVRGRVRNVYYAGSQLLGWVDGDWKAVVGSTGQRRRLLRRPVLAAVGPNDPEFGRAGWIRVTTPEASP